MKITARTIEILKNFASINNSIFFDEPSIIKTRTIAGNVIAVADIEETDIPNFGIYNLSEFLGMISLFDIENTQFEFQEKFVRVKCGRRHFRYIYTDPDLLPTFGGLKPSAKYKQFDKFDCRFKLDEKDLVSLKRASSIMKLTHIDVKASNGNGTFKILDQESSFSNNYEVAVESEGNCDISLNVEYLSIIPGDYDVQVSGKKLIKFTRSSGDLFYFISPKA